MLDDDPDFILSKAEVKKLEEAQAAELQDADPVPAQAMAAIPEASHPPDMQPAAAAATAVASGLCRAEHDMPDIVTRSDSKEPADLASPGPADDAKNVANRAEEPAANRPQLQQAVSGPAVGQTDGVTAAEGGVTVGQTDAGTAAESSATVGQPDADKAAKRSTTSLAGSSAAAAGDELHQAPQSSAPAAAPAFSSSTAHEASTSAGGRSPVKPAPAVMSEEEKISAAIKRIVKQHILLLPAVSTFSQDCWHQPQRHLLR